MAVAITQTANPAGVTAVSSVTTYSAASIGTASDDRIVVVLIGKEVATVVVNSVTIGGIPAILVGGTTFGSMGSWIYFASFPTNTTADIAVTWSGAITSIQNHIAVYALTGARGPPLAGTNTSTDMDSNSPLTTGSSTIPTSGGMIAVASCAADAITKTWANLTIDVNSDAGDFQFTSATSITAGAATRTCTGSTNLEDGVLAWAIFSPIGDIIWPTRRLPVLPPGAVNVVNLLGTNQPSARSELTMPPYRT